MVCGVRGTIGVVSTDKKDSYVYILEGKVQLTGKYFDKKDTFYVPAGEIAIIHADKIKSDDKNVYNSHVESRKLVEKDIEPWVAKTIKDNKKLTKRVKKATKLDWESIFKPKYDLANRFDRIAHPEWMKGSDSKLTDWDGSEKVFYFVFLETPQSGKNKYADVSDISVGKTLEDCSAKVTARQDVYIEGNKLTFAYTAESSSSVNEETKEAAQKMVDDMIVKTEVVDSGRVLKVTMSSPQLANRPLFEDDSSLGITYIGGSYTLMFSLDFSNSAGDKVSQSISIKNSFGN